MTQKLKVGDKVKILRHAESYRDGWCNTWLPEMHGMVGSIGTIKNIDPVSGVYFNEFGYGWPPSVLEIVKDEPTLVEVKSIETFAVGGKEYSSYSEAAKVRRRINFSRILNDEDTTFTDTHITRILENWEKLDKEYQL